MPRRTPKYYHRAPLRAFVCSVTLADGRQLTTTIHAPTPHDAETQPKQIDGQPVTRITVRQELSA